MRKTKLSAEKQSKIVSAATSRYDCEPPGEATLTSNPRGGALRGSIPANRKYPGVYSPQVVEAQDEEDEETDFLDSRRLMRLPMKSWRSSLRKQSHERFRHVASGQRSLYKCLSS